MRQKVISAMLSITVLCPLALILFLLVGCSVFESDTNWDPLPMVMVDNTAYMYYETSNSKYQIAEDQILGYITSFADHRPLQDGEATFPAVVGEPYGRFSNKTYPDAIVVRWNNKWCLFVPTNS